MTEPAERTLRAARVLAAVLLIVPLAVIVLVRPLHALDLPEPAIALASLAGIIAPVIALHGYRKGEAGIVHAGGMLERAALLRRITLRWLALSGAVALAGSAVYLASADVRACVGSVLHLLVGAAVWPTSARVERLVEHADD